MGLDALLAATIRSSRVISVETWKFDFVQSKGISGVDVLALIVRIAVNLLSHVEVALDGTTCH